eukprot:1267549-Prymnesium_polylepis.1
MPTFVARCAPRSAPSRAASCPPRRRSAARARRRACRGKERVRPEWLCASAVVVVQACSPWLPSVSSGFQCARRSSVVLSELTKRRFLRRRWRHPPDDVHWLVSGALRAIVVLGERWHALHNRLVPAAVVALDDGRVWHCCRCGCGWRRHSNS